MFTNPQFPVERNIFRKADGSTAVLSMIIRNTFQGGTDQLPESWHRKLVVALSHDDVTVESERLLSDVVLDGDYEINWQDFLQYPIAPAKFNVQVTPFNATNSNCQTCEEISQVVLVDDSTTDVWDEGTTNIFPDVLTDNDSICCLPYTIELVYYNTLYFTSVTISEDGVLTATVIDPAPVLDNVFIARYRVTCANGQYDDADVYGNITGSDSSFCYPVVGGSLIYSSTGTGTTANISWDPYFPPPPAWIWELYNSADLGTLLQSGSVSFPDTQVVLTGLTAGVLYTISVKSDCGGYDYSEAETLDFAITSFASSTCGQFRVDYIPSVDPLPQSISYMDCAGVITNVILSVSQSTNFCMLITPGDTVPLFFVASSDDISINYLGLCP